MPLLPIMLAASILAAWQGGWFGGSDGTADKGLAAGGLDNGEMKDMTDVDRDAGVAGTEAMGPGVGRVGATGATGTPTGVSDAGAPCPVPLPPDYRAVAYDQGAAIERWQASSDMSCHDAARELLLALQEEGFELVRAGYIDISGEAWGCTVKTQEGESLVISLVPEVLGALRDEQNRLTLTIVRVARPEATGITEDAS